MKIYKVVILSLLLFPVLATANKDDVAKVITSASNAAQCISPVHIRQIDGKEKSLQRMGFDLEPGTHRLAGSALINTSYCPTVGRSHGNDQVQPIEAEFEAGKTYYLGINHKSPDRKNWEYVIWKVRDTK